MIHQTHITLPAYKRGFHLITPQLLAPLGKLPEAGLVNFFLQHTSAALSINENADPDVRPDLAADLDRIVPQNSAYYRHRDEGPDDMPAHTKSSLVGVSLTVPIQHGRLALGTWQGIYLCEFRNSGGQRRIVATVYS